MYIANWYYTNFKWIGLQVSVDDLQEYVNCIDAILKEFNQPTFYKKPKFHTSLLWSLQIRDTQFEWSKESDNSAVIILEEELQGVMKKINKDFQAALENEVVSMAQSQDRYALPHVQIFISHNFFIIKLYWFTARYKRILGYACQRKDWKQTLPIQRKFMNTFEKIKLYEEQFYGWLK